MDIKTDYCIIYICGGQCYAQLVYFDLNYRRRRRMYFDGYDMILYVKFDKYRLDIFK